MSCFDFVYDHYDESITTPLKEAEKLFWTNYVASGVELRKVLEKWCNSCILEHHLPCGTGQTLDNKIKDLFRFFPAAMKKKTYTYIAKGGKPSSVQKGWDLVWRGFGNACAHTGELKPDFPSACFENLSIVFGIVYEFFYCDAIEKGYKMPIGTSNRLNLNKMPIDNNTILLEKKCPDPLCAHEFVTVSCSEAGTIENYGIIRIFEKDKLRRGVPDIAAQTKEYETYISKIKKLNLPSSCCKEMEVLSSMGSAYSDFFIVKYQFENEPYSLTNPFLKKISLKQKFMLCRDLAVQLNEYHKAGVYHRNLNYTSVALCDDGNGDWKPSIIKLEYAKNINSAFTVIARVESKAIADERISKYEDGRIADFLPQEPTAKNWKLADIYSLGVLFRDILTENVSQTQLGTMPCKGVSTEIWKLVKDMSSTVTEDRPALIKVALAFQNEINTN